MSCLQELCAFVDDTDSYSATGMIFSKSHPVVTDLIQFKEEAKSQCSSFETCAQVTNKAVDKEYSVSRGVSSWWVSLIAASSHKGKGPLLNGNLTKPRKNAG